MSGPLLLPTWADLAIRPLIVEPMRRYLEQIACVLRPGSVTGADLALRSFAAFLAETAPQVTTIGQVTRGHIESYKPWLAKRPGQNKSRLTTATLALRQDRQPHRRRRVLRGHRPGRRPLRQDRPVAGRRDRAEHGPATPRAPPAPRQRLLHPAPQSWTARSSRSAKPARSSRPASSSDPPSKPNTTTPQPRAKTTAPTSSDTSSTASRKAKHHDQRTSRSRA